MRRCLFCEKKPIGISVALFDKMSDILDILQCSERDHVIDLKPSNIIALLRASLLLNRGPVERYNLFPLQNRWLHEQTSALERKHWLTEKIDFSHSLDEYRKMPRSHQLMLRRIHGFFAVGDGFIVDNLVMRFLLEATSPEEIQWFSNQLANESVHVKTYQLIIHTLWPNESEEIRRMVTDDPSTVAKTKVIEEYINGNKSMAERLAAMAAIEIIFFSSSFCIIFWFKKMNPFDAIGTANKYIFEDEALHGSVGAGLCRQHGGVSEAFVREMISKIVETEISFMKSTVIIDEAGLNVKLVEEYIHAVANKVVSMLGHKPFYEAKNPFPDMDLMALQIKENGFEVTTSNYRQSTHDDKIATAFEDPSTIEI
jgi:ribonucleoside-diphosphate reductase subunit M2